MTGVQTCALPISPIIQISTTNLTEYHALTPTISESESEVHQSETWGPVADELVNDNQLIAAPGPLDNKLAATLHPVVSLQGLLPLDLPTMSVNVTTTTPTQNPPSNGGMRGVPPMIFNGSKW